MAINLGSVNFRLGADTSALRASVQTLKQFGSAVDAASSATTKAGLQAAAVLRKQEKAAADTLRQTLNLNKTLRTTEYGKTQLIASNQAWQRYNAAMISGKLSALDFQRATLQFNNTQAAIRRNLALNSRTTTGFAGTLRRAAQEAVLLYGPLGGVSTRLSTLASIAESSSAKMAAFFAAAAVTSIGLGYLANRTIQAGAEMQRYTGALVGVTGSQEQANAAVTKAKEIAQATGQQYSSVLPAYTSFTAAVKDTALEGDVANAVFLSVAKVAGNLQLPVEQSTGAFRALEQMVSKGTVQAEELRGQLGDRLPGAFQIAARAMGVSTAQLSDMMKKGEVATSDFLPKFAAELERTYGTASLSKINNYTAAQNRMFNSFTDFFVRVNELTDLSGKAQRFFDIVASGMEWLTTHLEDIGRVLVVVLSGFSSFIAAQIGVAFVKIASAIWTAVVALRGMSLALTLPGFGTIVNLAMMAATTLFFFNDAVSSIVSPLTLVQGLLYTIGGVLGGLVVTSLLSAVVGVGSLAGALIFLRGILLRTGLGAVIVLAGELVYWFSKLVEKTGSVGEAWGLLVDVAAEAFSRIPLYFDSMVASIMEGGYRMIAMFWDVMAKLTVPAVNAANYILNVFEGAYNAIVAVFSSIPSALGDLMYQGANAVAKAVEAMINKVLSGIDSFRSAIHSAMSSDWIPESMRVTTPFVPLAGSVNLGVENPYAGAATNAVNAAQAAYDKAFEDNPIKMPDFVTEGGTEARAIAEGYAEAAGMLADGATRPLTAWQKLKALFTGTTDTVNETATAVDSLGETITDAVDGGGKGGKGKGAKEKVKELIDRFKELRETIKSSLSDAFMSIVDGTKSVKDAFADMATAIIKELYNVLVVQRLVGAWGTTTQRGTGILGWVGAIFPKLLPVGKTAASNSSLSTQMPSSSGKSGLQLLNSGTIGKTAASHTKSSENTPVIINQQISIGTGVNAAARAELLSLMPQIKEATVKGVLEAKQRGGRFAAAMK